MDESEIHVQEIIEQTIMKSWKSMSKCLNILVSSILTTLVLCIDIVQMIKIMSLGSSAQ